MLSAVITYEDGRVSIHDSATKNVGVTFQPGFYKATTDQNGNMKIKEDALTELHEPYLTHENQLILKTVESFFAEGVEAKVKKLGFVHKLGVLLHGKQGTGKTSILNFLANALVKERGAVVLFCDNSNSLASAIGLAKLIREIQDNPIIFIADEFERYAVEAESEMKNLLDGNMSVPNSLFLAATNYITRVPETLSKRPSRFKVVLEIKGMADKAAIRSIIEEISNRITPSLFTPQEINAELDKIVNVTMDEIKHICLDKLTDNYLPKSTNKASIGFNAKEDEPTKSDAYNGAFFSLKKSMGKIPNSPSNL